MEKHLVKAALIGSVTVLAIISANAQEGSSLLAKQLAPARAGGGTMLVTSNSIRHGSIDDRYTQNGENVSPGINWTKGPLGTQSYAVILEDAGLGRTEPA